MVIVFYLANLFAKKFDKLDQPMVSLMPATVTSLILVATVYFQNDFSKSLFIILVVLVMFFHRWCRLEMVFCACSSAFSRSSRSWC